MDVRYHMIHWVHRRTRGWSYGASIQDPRTGEILKGNVLLGSLRVRQDLLKFVGLEAPFSDEGACLAAASPTAGHLLLGDDAKAQEVALARIRQLAAHEVGHTLGLSHNFAASVYGRASVMDYPAPLVTITDDEQLDFAGAYAAGIGAYDKWAITWGYAQFAQAADEQAELERIVQDGLAQGWFLLTDQDARNAGTGHPLASLWDNGADPLSQLELEMRVRAIGLRRFGIGALRPGASLASLEDALVPLFLHHRYQLDAVMKVIGGVDFRHAVKGDGQVANTPVDRDRQVRAVELVLRTLRPEFLRVDPRIVAEIPPAPPGHPGEAERFPRSTGQAIDPVAMAVVCADLTISGLLHPERAARLEHRGDGEGMTFDWVVRQLVDAVFGGVFPADAVVRAGVWRAVQSLCVDRLMDLAANRSAAAAVRDVAEAALARVADIARSEPARLGYAHAAGLARGIGTFLDDPARQARRLPDAEVPPGSPIGGGR
jgi:hypothetical protein